MTRIMLKEGLDVRDARLETLRRLFSEMQRYTVETCGTDDLLEFVGSTAYFATTEDSESKVNNHIDTHRMILICPVASIF